MSSPGNSRRQPAITAASTAGSNDMSPLASMYADLLQLVGWRLLSVDFSDYVRLRAVCRHWRSSTDSPSGRGIIDPRFHPRRWMLLPDSHGLHPADGRKRFFNLSLGEFICCRVPLLEYHRILCSVEGLLLLQRQDDSTICLLHPFTGDVARFPPISYHTICLASAGYKLRGEGCHNLLPGSVTASLSVSPDGAPTIMATLSDVSRVLFATTKDRQWRFSAWSLSPKGSTISSQGKLYVLQKLKSSDDDELRILQIDPPCQHDATSGVTSSSFPAPKVIAAVSPAAEIREPLKLVECDSDILLVGSSDDHVVLKRMVVYRVADLAVGSVAPLTSINGNALLTDLDTTFSVASRAMPIVTCDTVVRRGPTCDKSLELYHLRSGTWSSIAGRCHHKPSGHEHCVCKIIHHIYGTCHSVVTP